MARKPETSSEQGKVKVRFFEFEVSGDDSTIQEGLRSMTCGWALPFTVDLNYLTSSRQRARKASLSRMPASWRPFTHPASVSS